MLQDLARRFERKPTGRRPTVPRLCDHAAGDAGTAVAGSGLGRACGEVVDWLAWMTIALPSASNNDSAASAGEREVGRGRVQPAAAVVVHDQVGEIAGVMVGVVAAACARRAGRRAG